MGLARRHRPRVTGHHPHRARAAARLYAARIKQGLDVEEYLSSVRDYFRRLPADRFPLVSSMADTIISDGEQRFEFGLDLLLAGLAALP